MLLPRESLLSSETGVVVIGATGKAGTGEENKRNQGSECRLKMSRPERKVGEWTVADLYISGTTLGRSNEGGVGCGRRHESHGVQGVGKGGGKLVCWSGTDILDIAGLDYGPSANTCAHTKAGPCQRPGRRTAHPGRAVPSVEWPESPLPSGPVGTCSKEGGGGGVGQRPF